MPIIRAEGVSIRYITGDLPQPKSIPKEMSDKHKKGSAIYPWEILLYDERLVVSPKVKEPYLIDLIESMLQPKPESQTSPNTWLTKWH